MGYYTQIDADDAEVEQYASKIGVLITLLNSLDYQIQIFIETILDLEKTKPTNYDLLTLIRSFEFSKRLNFLKSLIKKKHADKLEEYLKLHDEIIKCGEVRNKFAHSQVYFWDDPRGTHMMISSIKKIEEYAIDDLFDQVSITDLVETTTQFRDVIKRFNEFTYSLGYFQG